jgi:mannose-6-phosphate isomerase-like protein (cupin superfamily)
MTERNAHIVTPQDGDTIDAGGDRYRFLAETSHTDGAYAIWEAVVPPGGGPPPHLHTREEEGFYVISGEVTIHVDGKEVTATPGSFVNMPKGSTHWFRNNTQENAKLLVLVAPGGMEQMFRETGVMADADSAIPELGPEEKKRLVEITPKYGIELKIPTDPH